MTGSRTPLPKSTGSAEPLEPVAEEPLTWINPLSLRILFSVVKCLKLIILWINKNEVNSFQDREKLRKKYLRNLKKISKKSEKNI